VIGFPAGALFGQRWITIGAGTMIAAQVSLSAGMVPGQDLGDWPPVLRIGDRCVIGRGSHVVAHYSIAIGDDVFTGPNVYITDQNHGYADPDLPIGRQWPSNTAVSIGAGSWLGAGVIVLPGACIGRNVVVAAGSVVRGQVPDRCVVANVVTIAADPAACEAQHPMPVGNQRRRERGADETVHSADRHVHEGNVRPCRLRCALHERP